MKTRMTTKQAFANFFANAQAKEETQLYKVVGKKNGQQIEVTDSPMSLDNCEKWIKEQGIEAHYTNVFSIPYHGNKPEHKL